MTYGRPDLYFQPEHFGLTPIGELNDPEECYSFDTLAVWQHEDGRIFAASDCGCSCPSPFEDYMSLDDADEVTLETWGEFADAVANHCKYDPDTIAAERTALLSKVSGLLRRKAGADPSETVA